MKKEIKKKDEIIKQQNKRIQELENQLCSDINLQNKIKNLQNLVEDKDKELNKLKLNLINNQNIIKDIDKCVNFISDDQKIFFAIPCSGDTIFAQIEEKLYQEYPEYRETNNIFLSNGKEILRFKTINENNIGSGRPIMLVVPS